MKRVGYKIMVIILAKSTPLRVANPTEYTSNPSHRLNLGLESIQSHLDLPVKLSWDPPMGVDFRRYIRA